MKVQIRIGTFETNSSSVHALILCNKETYEQWKRGEVVANFYPYKNETNFLSKDDPKYQDDPYDYKTYEDVYGDDAEFESFYKELDTPDGETIVALGYFGRDG